MVELCLTSYIAVFHDWIENTGFAELQQINLAC